MEKTAITVSVIIPVYNAAEYIRGCIKSIQKQSLKSLEILCVDDGSLDNTVEIIKELRNEDPRIVLLHQNHGGAGKARNLALSIAKGIYISFLDADDFYFDPQALEVMVSACEINDVFVCGSLRREFLDGEEIDIDIFSGRMIPGDSGCRICFEEFQEDFYFQNFIFKQSFLRTHCFTFPEYSRYEDPPFFLNVMITAGEFWVVPVVLYRYRGGHFFKKVSREEIIDTLQGIRDNLRTAVINQYETLFVKIIDRLNSLYYKGIEMNLSEEVLTLMLEINEINQNSYRKRINLLENLYQMPAEFSNLFESYEMLRQIVTIIQRGDLKSYLDRHCIRCVTVYGLGMYGNILVDELKREGISIIAGIDAKIKERDGIRVIKPDDEIPECDAIIVSPIKSEGIMSLLKKKKVKIPIITLKKIVETLEQEREAIVIS